MANPITVSCAFPRLTLTIVAQPNAFSCSVKTNLALSSVPPPRPQNAPTLQQLGIVSLNPPASNGSSLVGALNSLWKAWVMARQTPGAATDLDLGTLMLVLSCRLSQLAPTMPGLPPAPGDLHYVGSVW